MQKAFWNSEILVFDFEESEKRKYHENKRHQEDHPNSLRQPYFIRLMYLITASLSLILVIRGND